MLRFLTILVIPGLFLASHTAFADALVRSQAMFADTIAEFYVERDGVRVELEIGMNDLGAFRNLLPDAIYEGLEYGQRPLAERLAEFFASDLAIISDDVELHGQLRSIGPRSRVVRDEITGEEQPVREEDAETVVVAELFYPFTGELPSTLVFNPPSQHGRANVGFVVYHNTVAVNDFRYLARGMSLALDWADPWYSEFRTRNMRRSYFAPMSGFLYIEPFEVRKEIIVRPKDMQRWVDLGLEAAEVIPAELHGQVLETIAGFLQERVAVTIDGETREPMLDRVNFLNRTLKSSMVVEPGIDIPLDSAVVGAIFVYPTSGLPSAATMTWDMFDERVQQVPASSVDEAGPLPTFLEPDFAVLEWQNFLQNPTDPGLLELATPPSRAALMLYSLRWWGLASAILLLVWFSRERKTLPGLLVSACLAAVALSFTLGRPLAPPGEATEQLVADLLRNVYKAFDYRAESDIYDALERSVSGSLLTDIYMETQRGLVLANQGGARAKVQSVDLQSLELSPGGDTSSMAVRATWNVNGSVGHWGHVHTRANQYQADLLLGVVDGRWKLANMDVLQEQRL